MSGGLAANISQVSSKHLLCRPQLHTQKLASPKYTFSIIEALRWFALVPAHTPSYLGFGHCVAGLDTGDSKLDQILSLLKAKTDPKARPISEVGSAEADSVLLELGFLQDDGNEVDPIVVPAGLSMCHSFDYSQFPSEDDNTPALLQHHQQQLSGFEVQFGRSQFQMYDIHHRKDLKLILPSGVSYIGGLDGVAAPWGLAKAGAVSEMRIAYEHKQSSAQKQAYREANPQYYEVNLLHKQSRSGKILYHVF